MIEDADGTMVAGRDPVICFRLCGCRNLDWHRPRCNRWGTGIYLAVFYLMEADRINPNQQLDIETRLSILEGELSAIRSRNDRVTAEKAWETSVVRRATICIITFALAALLLFLLGNDNFLRNALVPTLGYLLSTLTIPAVKRRWMGRYFRR